MREGRAIRAIGPPREKRTKEKSLNKPKPVINGARWLKLSSVSIVVIQNYLNEIGKKKKHTQLASILLEFLSIKMYKVVSIKH